MLADHLGMIDEACVVPESQFKIRAMHILEKQGPKAVRDFLGRDVRYRLWEKTGDSGDLSGCGTAEMLLRHLVSRYLENDKPKKLVLDHTPNNLENFELLAKSFPTAKFIHIVRDGRAVANSVISCDWGPNNHLDSASWWLSKVATGLALERSFLDKVIGVRYESLVAQDVGEWGRLLEFVGVRPDKTNLEKVWQGGAFKVSAYTAAQHAKVGSGLDASASNSWKESTESREQEIFESIAGGALYALGYQTQFVNPRPATKYEKLMMFEWPVATRVRPFKLLKNRIRKLRLWRSF